MEENLRSSTILLFSALVFGSVANATLQRLPNPDTPSYIGTSVSITADWWIPGTEHVGGGGAFAGTVTPKNSTATINTAFWCVDDQTYFTPSLAPPSLANITLLSDLHNPPGGLLSQTEYINVLTSPNKFTNTILDPNSGNASITDPQTRLLMAAYLITQYGGYATNDGSFSQLPINGAPPNGGPNLYTNSDIQNAIWAITNNTAFSNHSAAPGYSDASPAGVAYWIDKARNNYGSVNPNSWALVTWKVDSIGTVTSPQQNFLVAVAPEPGFYGALALGLSGLALVIRRKRK